MIKRDTKYQISIAAILLVIGLIMFDNFYRGPIKPMAIHWDYSQNIGLIGMSYPRVPILAKLFCGSKETTGLEGREQFIRQLPNGQWIVQPK